jgi:hypothetical protein
VKAAALVLAAALAAVAGCSRGGPSAVPAEVEIDWPDAAVFPDPDQPPDAPGRDGGAGGEPDPGSEAAPEESGSPMAPSISTGSTG